VRSRQTYQEIISVKAEATQKQSTVSLNNFERFTGEKIEKTIDRIKDDEDEVFDLLNRWVSWNYKNGVTRPKQYFIHLNQFFYYMKIKLTPMDVKLNINFPKRHFEELHGITIDEIRQVLAVMPYHKRALYIAKLSSGMRENEICNIKKKDIDLSKARMMIKIPAKYTKTKHARTTFVSSEASKMIMSKLMKLNDDDRVWSDNDTVSEGKLFARYVDKAGLGDMRYETTHNRMINTHALRAYFITKVSRYDRDLALILAGQGSGTAEIEYDRLSPDEKLELYMRVEPELIIDSSARDKIKIEKVEKENSELQKAGLMNKSLESRLTKVEEEANLSSDLVNELLQIARHEDFGATKKQADDLFDKDFIPKFNKLLKLQQAIKEAKTKSAL